MALAPAASTSRTFAISSSLGSSFSEPRVCVAKLIASSFHGRLVVAKEAMDPRSSTRTHLHLSVCASSAMLEGVPSTACGNLTVVNADMGDHKPELLQRCECYDLYDQCIPYMDAWMWQKALVKRNTEAIQEGNDVDDALIILQHTPVYTMGTRSSEEYLLFDKDQPPCDLYRTERGGEVTYHGPGQLVMYPILNLRHFQTDLHWYLRSLEEVVIRALWNACGIEATRIKGLTGVWVGTEKVAAIGVRVSRWVTYHGLALNVTTDLSPFKRIVPCGIRDYSVGSVAEILQRRGVLQASPEQSHFCLNQTEHLLDLLHKRLLDEFTGVFGLNLSHASQNASIFSTSFGT